MRIGIGIIGACILGAIVLLLLLSSPDNQEPESTTSHTKAAAETFVAPSMPADNMKSTGKASLVADQTGVDQKLPKTPNFEYEDRLEFDEFMISRGYMLDPTNPEYTAYDTETLQELVANGDTTAMYILGNRYSMEQDYEAATQAFAMAAIYGSTAALRDIAHLFQMSSKSHLDLDSSDQRREVMNAMSYSEVARLRGDLMPLVSAQVFLETYEIEKFTAAETQQIRQQAQFLYDNLEGARKDRGLGEFDNNTPEIIQQFQKGFVSLEEYESYFNVN